MRLGRRRTVDEQLLADAEAAEKLFRAGKFERARVAFVASVAAHQAVLPERMDDLEFNARIGGLLNNLGLTLSRLRRYPEAAQVLDGAVAIFDGLVNIDDPVRWRPFLAGSLQSLAAALTASGQSDRALTVSREAVELRRHGPPDADQAKAMRMFALVRVGLGVELEEALLVLGDAMAAHLSVLNRTPDEAYLPEIYLTELAQSQVLERLGRTEDGARVASLARSDHLAELPEMLRNQSGGWAGPPTTR